MRVDVLQGSSRSAHKMANLTVVMMLLVAVAAAEARARGAKLGHRYSRQNLIWGRQRQDPAYPQTPAGYAQQPQTYPQPQGGQGSYPSTSVGTQQPTSGYPAQSQALAPVPVTQGGYQQGGGSPPPVIVTGIAPLSPTVCKYPGFFPTPGSCVNFYRCVDFSNTGSYYSVFQFNCPLGTIFDDDLDICNHIAWTVPKRPECADMLHGSLVPEGSAPGPAGITGAVTYPKPGQGTQSPYPGTHTERPGAAYPQPGGQTGGAVSPDAPPRPFVLQCNADDSYRRHPIYCNRYYRCTWNGEDWVFPMLSCPEGLIFNEGGQKCSDPASTAYCDGRIAPHPSADILTTTEIPTESPGTDIPMVDPSSLYDCPATGYFPFEGDCLRFYKCVELESGALKGLLYKCPAKYGYSEEKKRCDKEERLPVCQKELQAVHLRLAPAKQLHVEDLLWFFNN